MTCLPFPAGPCDSSGFIAEHAGGSTPTTIGETVAKLRVETLGEALIANILRRAGVILDHVEFVRVHAMLVPIHDLLVLEAAEVLSTELEPAPAEVIYLDGIGLAPTCIGLAAALQEQS